MQTCVHIISYIINMIYVCLFIYYFSYFHVSCVCYVIYEVLSNHNCIPCLSK